MNILRLIEVTLSAWYISYVLSNTSGPFGLFKRLREWKGGRWHGRILKHDDIFYTSGTPENPKLAIPAEYADGLLDCIICLMPWTALVLWLVPDGIVIWTLAAAGLALMLHSFTGWKFSGG